LDNDTHTENYQLHLTVICTVKLKTGVELQLSELNSNFTLMRKGLYEEVFVHAASYKNICVLRSILLTVVSLFTLMAFGQTVHENTGWFAWFNSYKFSAHWGIHFDGQIRSADD